MHAMLLQVAQAHLLCRAAHDLLCTAGLSSLRRSATATAKVRSPCICCVYLWVIALHCCLAKVPAF